MVSADDALAIADALYRFGAGQDLRDRLLFESAFAEHATLDFTEVAAKLGADIGVFEGRSAIVETIMAATEPLRTTHTVTNPRITAFDGERATLFALVEAQHLPNEDMTRHLLLKNICDVDVVRGEADWRIERAIIRNVWLHGDPSVLFPASS